MSKDTLNTLPVKPEEELEQIIKMSIHCICIADIHTTCFLQVNPAFETILGYKPKELINHSFLDFIHPDDIEPTRNVVEKALKKGKKVIHFENRYRCKDGHYVWFEWVSHPDVAKGITYAIASDITEKKQTQNDLAESERKFRTLFERSSDPILILENGTFTDCNKAALSLLGFTDKTNIIQKKPYELSPEFQPDGSKSEDLSVQYIREAMEKGYKRFEWVHKGQNSEEYWLDVSLTNISDTQGNKMFTVWRDITNLKAHEEEVRNKSQEMEEIFEAIPDAIVYADKDRKITKVNKAFTRIFGYKPEEILGQPTLILYESKEEFLHQGKIRYNAEAVDTHEPYYTRYKRKNGEIFPTESVGTPVRNIQGNVIGLLGIVRDITERLNAEQALRESEERFKQLFDNMADGVAIYQPDAEGMHFRFIDINKAGEKLSKINSNQIKGKFIHDVFPGAVDYGILAALRKVSKTGKPVLIPYKEYNDIHLTQWVENYIFRLPSGNLVAIFKDTSKERQALLDLQEFKGRLDLAMESANQGIWEWDLEKDLVYFDKNASMMLGYKNQSMEVSGSTATGWIHPEDHENIMKTFQNYLNEQVPGYQVEFRIQKKDRQYIWVLSNGRIIRRNKENKPILVIGMHNDISFRKNTESELLKYKNKLEELVQERTHTIEEKNKELERMNSLFVGREFRIKELKDTILALKEKMDKTAKEINE